MLSSHKDNSLSFRRGQHQRLTKEKLKRQVTDFLGDFWRDRGRAEPEHSERLTSQLLEAGGAAVPIQRVPQDAVAGFGALIIPVGEHGLLALPSALRPRRQRLREPEHGQGREEE